MNDMLIGIGAGLIFATGGMIFFGVLMGIGYMIEWYERRVK
tara:strand:+ start:295 stop:417 length:123 start_codon:yes stop_codon:yes gene_type:complete